MWLTTADACKHYNRSGNTLRTYDAEGKIKTKRTAGGQRRFWSEYASDGDPPEEPEKDPQESKTIIYARVSTHNQKEALKRQIGELERYSEQESLKVEVVQDIGSGINFKRPGLKKIIDLAYQGNLREVIVTDRDRLARFAFDLIEDILKRNQVKITVVHADLGSKTKSEELAEDLLTIVHVFSARANGGKRYNRVIRPEGQTGPESTEDHEEHQDNNEPESDNEEDVA